MLLTYLKPCPNLWSLFEEACFISQEAGRHLKVGISFALRVHRTLQSGGEYPDVSSLFDA